MPLAPMQYRQDFASGANWDSAWICARGYRRIEFGVAWTDAFSDGVTGAINMEGATHLDQPLDTSPVASHPDAEYIVTPIPVLTGFYGNWPNVIVGQNRMIVVVENPITWLRLHFQSTAGAVRANYFKLAVSLS